MRDGDDPAKLHHRLDDALALAKAAEARFSALIELVADGVFVLCHGVVRSANRAAAELLGCAQHALVGRRVLDFVDGEHAALARRLLEAQGERTQGPAVVKFLRPDASTRALEIASRALDDRGAPLVLAVARDVGERARAEGRAMHAQRMASLGTMAAGVAHAVNSPLSSVIANIDLVVEELRTWERSGRLDEMVEALEEALAGANEARQVVRSLKAFARVDDETREPQDLHRLIDEAIELTRNETRHRARVIRDFAELPLVSGDGGKLTQVFVHLLVNAAQALSDGHADENEIRVRTYTEGGQAVVEVCDSGAGIHDELVQRVFEPFLTTRAVGEGSGLGLAVSHGIITAHGGQIAAHNRPEGGACFRIVLPACADERVLRTSGVSAASTHKGRVLVIDDDARVARSIARVLKREHDVTLVTRGAEALEMLAGGERFDVILCDLMMPVMTGMDVHAALMQSAPEIARELVFITGGAFSKEASAFLAEIPNPVVEKPFDPRNLRAMIRTLVDLRRQARRSSEPVPARASGLPAG